MIRIRFVDAGGTVRIGAGDAGATLLSVAQALDYPLEGTCGGDMACATCHVVIDPADHDRLPPPREEEEDMLDFATGATRTSRLSCQVRLTAALEGMTVRIP